MGNILHTVGPGKDYATLAAWASARLSGGIGPSNSEQADCYAGSDLGLLNLTSSWTAQSTLIQGATGNRHNGTNAGATGVASSTGLITTMDVATPVTFQYLRLTRAIQVSNTTTVTNTYHITGNLFAESGSTTGRFPGPIYVDSDAAESAGTPNITAYVVNNILYMGFTTGSGSIDGIVFETFTDGTTVPGLTAYCINNSILVNTTLMDGGQGVTFIYDTLSSGSVVAYNNAIQSNNHADTPFAFQNNAALTITCDDQNNVTDGAGAKGWGQNGAGSVNDAGQLFSTATDARLFLGSGALNAGTSAAAAYGASPDAVGTTRPQGGFWDAGALEFPQAVSAAGGGGGSFWPYWWYNVG